MAGQSYDVDIVLKAKDEASSKVKGVGSAMDGLKSSISSTGDLFKTIFGANLISSAVTSGISAVTNGIRGMANELLESGRAWKVFEGNEATFGRTRSEINQTKAALQDYAQKTVYSASEMASTYSQMDAILSQSSGNMTKDVKGLVTAMGGLAATAENPKQAMKSLSEQMTQALAKPTVQWQDFRIMLEQAPAGMSAVAKNMGKSMDQLIKDIQDGKVSTSEFTDALIKAGNDPSLQKMATQYKDVGQAMDGLKETVANRLQPAFEVLNQAGIKAISAIGDQLNKIDVGALTKKFQEFTSSIDWGGVAGYVTKLGSSVASVVKSFANTGGISAFKNIISAVGTAIPKVIAVAKQLAPTFGAIANGVSKAVKGFAEFVSSIPTPVLSALAKAALAAVAAFKAFKIISGIIGFLRLIGSFGRVAGSGVSSLTGAVTKLAGGLLKAVSNALTTLARGLAKAANSANPAQWLSFGVAMVAIGASVYIIAQGFSVLAQTAIQLASAGLGAQVMFGALTLAIVGIVGAFALMAPALTAGAVGLVAFGATVALIGAGVALAAAGIALVIQTVANNSAQLSAIIGAISGAISSTLSGIAGVITSVGSAISAALNGIANVFKSAGTAISTASKGVGQGIKTAFDGVANVIKSIGTSIKAVLDGVAKVFNSMGNAAKNAGIGVEKIANAIAKLTHLNAGDMANTLIKLASGLTKIGAAAPSVSRLASPLNQVKAAVTSLLSHSSQLAARFTQLSAVLPSVTGGFNTFKSAIQQSKTAFSGVTGPMTIFRTNITQLRGPLSSVAGSFAQFVVRVRQAVSSLTTAGAGFALFTVSLQQIGTSVQQVVARFNLLSAGAQRAIQSIGQLSGLSAQVSAAMASLGSVMASAGSAMASGMTSAMNSVKNAAISGMNEARSSVTNGMSSIANGVRDGANKMSSAMKSGMTSINNVLKSGLRSAVSEANSYRGEFTRAGRFLGEGVAVGMEQALPHIRAAAQQIINTAREAAQAAAQIHSPSRLMRDEVGLYLGQGIGVGITKAASFVKERAKDLIDEVAEYTSGEQLGFAFGGDARVTVSGTVEQRKNPQLEDLRGDIRKLNTQLQQLNNKDTNLYIDGERFAQATASDISRVNARAKRLNSRLTGGE